jgi:hypothetical protein
MTDTGGDYPARRAVQCERRGLFGMAAPEPTAVMAGLVPAIQDLICRGDGA